MKTNIISLVFVAVATLFCVPIFSQINDATPQREVEYQQDYKYKDFRLAVGGGYAYGLGSIDKTDNTAIDDMGEKLRHGYVIDADAQYFFKQAWGLGINANMCVASTSGGGFTIPDVGTINSYKETQRILYVGPSFNSRNETDKFLLITSIGLGPLFFMNNININGVEGNGNQTTLGINVGVSGEYKMNNKVGLGLKLAYTSGSIDSVNFEGQKIDAGKSSSISHLTASLFLSFRSW